MEFDYVVVGAGSAGCVVAARLSEDPSVRVALVEAGGADDHPDVAVPLATAELFGGELDWDLATTPQDGLAGRSVTWPRGRALGGSSTINFQMWVPGPVGDVDTWDAGPLWTSERFGPYFRRVERWAGDPADGWTHGDAGPLWISPPRDPDPSSHAFVEACAEVGLKPVAGGLGGSPDAGATLTPLTQLDGRRWSAADGYLRPALDRPNLTVITGTRVHRVVLSGNRATGVRLADGVLTARREVVLCAGAVGSPHLLMLSGIGDPDRLAAAGVEPRVALPAVGAGLHDHLVVDLPLRAAEPATRFTDLGPAARHAYERDRTGPFSSNLAEAVAFFRADGGAGPPDLELIWVPALFGADGAPLPGRTLGVVLLQPRSRGRVDLVDADPATPPRLDPGYLADPADVAALVRGVRFAEEVVAAPALRSAVSGPLEPWPADDEGLGGFVRSHAETVFHPVGTCRVGRGPDAAVDPRLKVRGVEGLRVVDASVIPHVPRGHTHAHAVAIGERGAELIQEEQ
ncbi:GMC family oxidoreductase [Saccharothrix obliqua]|uniref:GMC family oxidoreductase n=1 Tax=Saccharothrix obliqua TaxID=2861747 RepID=UPI001C5DBC46|nr:GMC family oxidoreductase N-terminal domain-containing protein [Saccharothrix obliqua]MBW4716736.1 GMC family oxidoreductase N-terminal domain-containing protein [Saccharothrix obliqua]